MAKRREGTTGQRPSTMDYGLSTTHRLFHGDNLEILRNQVADESVDLTYLDPPFNSNRTYRLEGQEAFTDSWRSASANQQDEIVSWLKEMIDEPALLAYLAMMAPRLRELRRVLKDTGSVFLHCDPRASHYLKVVMDSIFGAENFRNEVIWHYGGRGAKAVSGQFPRNHDVILVYSRTARSRRHNRQFLARVYTPDEARAAGFRRDNDGRWFKTAPRGDYSDESVARLESEGRLHRTRNGTPRIKYFLEERDGFVVEERLVGDTWLDIPDAMHLGSEATGYPTQKPEALLERVILSASDEGDTVLDPFCGSGTTLVVAQRLGRKWIGIDNSSAAIATAQKRLACAAVGSQKPEAKS